MAQLATTFVDYRYKAELIAMERSSVFPIINAEVLSMTQWLAQLQGYDTDLRALQEILSSHDPVIVAEQGKFYLKSKDWDRLEEEPEVRNKAKGFLESLDRAAHLHFRDTGPLAIDSIVRIDDDGKRRRYTTEEVSFEMRVGLRASRIDDQQMETDEEHSIIKTLRASQLIAPVATALRYFRNADWGSLYKAYEIVKSQVGGDKRIVENAWLTMSSIRRFRHTAQSAEVLKDEARHASGKFERPPNPMSIHEARAVIGDLVQRWVASL